jgi:tetratricopeptide (TPR) repeat protein
MSKRGTKIAIVLFVLLALAGAAVFILRGGLTHKKAKEAPVLAGEQSGPVVINPAAQTTNLNDEISRLQTLYSQAPAESFVRVRLQIAMGETYVKYGRVDEAIASFNEVIKKWPKENRSYYYLGVLYLSKGDTLKGMEYWEKYLQLDPQSYMRDSISTFLKNHKKTRMN